MLHSIKSVKFTDSYAIWIFEIAQSVSNNDAAKYLKNAGMTSHNNALHFRVTSSLHFGPIFASALLVNGFKYSNIIMNLLSSHY